MRTQTITRRNESLRTRTLTTTRTATRIDRLTKIGIPIELRMATRTRIPLVLQHAATKIRIRTRLETRIVATRMETATAGRRLLLRRHSLKKRFDRGKVK